MGSRQYKMKKSTEESNSNEDSALKSDEQTPIISRGSNPIISGGSHQRSVGGQAVTLN